MKPIDMYKWQVFWNTNGHLSLVYKIEHGRVHVINYNGSVYKLSTDSKKDYEKTNISAESFIREYPTRIFPHYEQAAHTYDRIKKELKELLNTVAPIDNELLLII